MEMKRLVKMLLMVAGVAQATTYTWDGETDGNWGVAANWVANGAPSASVNTKIIFNAVSAGNLNTFLGSGRSMSNLTFNADADSNIGIELAPTAGGVTAANLNLYAGSSGGPTINVDSGATANIRFFGTGAIGLGIGTGGSISNLTVNHNGAGNLSIEKNIGGVGWTVTKNGGGTFTLAPGAASTYNNFILNDGRVRIGGAQVATALGTNTVYLNGGTLSSDSTTARTIAQRIVISNNITLGHATDDGALTLNGATDLGGATRTIAADSAVTLGGVISNGGLTKAGGGTLSLSGNNTYSGVTEISAGTLLINGSTSTNTITVQTNSTLGGSGTINGSVTLSSGASLNPGDGIGSLTVNGALAFQPGSFTAIEINKALSSHDMVAGMTRIQYDGTLTVTNLAGIFEGGESYQLFSAGSCSGSFTATNLPTLDATLQWRWNPTNGTLSVMTSTTNSIVVPAGTVFLTTNDAPALGDLTLSLINTNPSDYSVGFRVSTQTNGLWFHFQTNGDLNVISGSPTGNLSSDATDSLPLQDLQVTASKLWFKDFGDQIDVYGKIGTAWVPVVQVKLYSDYLVVNYNGRVLTYTPLTVPVASNGCAGVYAGSGPLTINQLRIAELASTNRFELLGFTQGKTLSLQETFTGGIDNPLAFRPWYTGTQWTNNALTLGRIDTLVKFGEADIRLDITPQGSGVAEIGMRQTYPFNRPWKVGGTWLVFQGNSNLLRIRKSISENQAEASVTMPQTFTNTWNIRIEDRTNSLYVYKEQTSGDILLARLVSTNGYREVRDSSGTLVTNIPLEQTGRGHITIKGAGILDNLSISGTAYYSAADKAPQKYSPDLTELFQVENQDKLFGLNVGDLSTYANTSSPEFSGIEALLMDPDLTNPLYSERTEFWLTGNSTEPTLYYKTSGNPEVAKLYLRMLAKIGVDFIIFMDPTNFDHGNINDNFLDAADLWLTAMLALRNEGIRVPRAVFWVNNERSTDASPMEVYERFYSKPEYKDLWLYWNQKPFLLTTVTRNTHFSILQNYFTVRSEWVTQLNRDWAHNMTSGAGASWTELANRGDIIDGTLEHMFVTPAIRINILNSIPIYNAATYMTNSLITDVASLTDLDDGWWRGRNQGKFFQLQWRQVFEQQPKFVTAMEWNEFGHSFDQEYGRNIAPMKDGHADRYMWMMKAYVDAYKSNQPFPENLLEGDFPFAGVMPVSAASNTLSINPAWQLSAEWPWPGHTTTLTTGSTNELCVTMTREARQWTMEGVEANFATPLNAGSRTWLTLDVALSNVVCAQSQDYELKVRVYGGERWTEGTCLLTANQRSQVAVRLADFAGKSQIDRIKIWVQGTRNTEYSNWTAQLAVYDVKLAGAVTRNPGKYNFEVTTHPSDFNGLRPGDQVPVYITNYDTEDLTNGIRTASSTNLTWASNILAFDRLSPRESTVLYLQGRLFHLTVAGVSNRPVYHAATAGFQYGSTTVTRSLAGPEDPLDGWVVSSSWDDVQSVTPAIRFGTGGGMIWPLPGGEYLPGTNVVGDLRIGFNLKLDVPGSTPWFHFNFRKSTQTGYHTVNGGYSVRLEASTLSVVAGTNSTLTSVNLQTLLGSSFSFTNDYHRVDISVVGESLSVLIDNAPVLSVNLRTLSPSLYVEKGMINFFNAPGRGVYSISEVSLEILDPPTIGTIADQKIEIGGSTDPLPFTIGSGQVSPDTLTLSGASSNPTLLPVTNMVFGGSGANRTVTATPLPEQIGSATVTVTVSDGTLTANTSFTLTVLPVLTCEFDTNTMTGWSAVAGDARQYFAVVPPNVYSPNVTPYSGASFIGLHIPGFTWGPPAYTQDSEHNTLVLRSPAFTLNGAGDLTAWLCGGTGSSTSLAGTAVINLPSASSASGFLGIALRDVTAGTYVLSGQKTSSGNIWQQVSLSASALAGLPQDHVYTLDLIDAFHGGWGWINMDSITIPGALWIEPVLDPPVLTIRRTNNMVRIAWPAAATGFTLKATSSLDRGFSNAMLNVTVESNENAVLDNTGLSRRFYRLVR